MKALALSLGLSLPLVCCSNVGKPNPIDNDTDSQTEGDTESVSDDDTETGVDTDSGTDTFEDAVDQYWGDAPDLDTRLTIFDEIWEILADEYAGFVTTEIDWDAAYDEYRPRIEDAQSYGRFYAVLSDLFYPLHDVHNMIGSTVVCTSPRSARPPCAHFKSAWSSAVEVCVSVQPDDSLLVYKASPDNPLGVQPGDLIMGYDGTPWAELVDQILHEWYLPLCTYYAAAESSQRIYEMESVLENAHLFGELDIVRQETSENAVVPTSSFIDNYTMNPTVQYLCSDQLPVDGVDLPWEDWGDYTYDAVNDVSWGILPETNIGYVYAYSWMAQSGFDFGIAIQELMDTDGLILDFRMNQGGSIFMAFDGAALLFQEDVVHSFNFMRRDHDYDDYYTMELAEAWGFYDLIANPYTYYDHPIAMLTGPKGMSAGDMVPYYFTHHPRVRRFGRATNGSFSGGGVKIWGAWTDPYVHDLYGTYDHAISVDGDENWLHRSEQTPEEEVWLTQDDVVAGVDTVVEAALDWIAEENAK